MIAPRPTLLLSVALAVGGTACHSVAQTREAPALDAPDAFATTGAALGEGGAGDWWRAVDPRGLDPILARALSTSPTIEAADARLRQAEAAAAQLGAGRWPTMQLEAGLTRARTIVNTPLGSSTDTSTRFSLALAASYEVDLWGRVRHGARAAALDRDAAALDLNVAAISLTAEAVEAWLDAAWQADRLALNERQAATSRRVHELALLRLSVGQGSAVDVFQQRQATEALEAQRPLFEGLREVAAVRLAAVQGMAATERAAIVLPAALPPAPVAMAAGVPADLLLARPDVRAALLRLDAADARVAVAVADRLPSLRISGRIEPRSITPSEFFEKLVWSVALAAVQPLIDGGRRRAEVDRTEAVADERLATLRGAFLTAIREVEDALAREDAQRRHVDALETQLATATLTWQLAQEQFGRGLIEYPRVLTALQAIERLEQERLSAARTLWTYRVALCRALGGDPRAYFATELVRDAAPGADEALAMQEEAP